MSIDKEVKTSDFLFYRGEDGKSHVQVILGDETVWTTQNGMSEMFGIDRSGINRHISNIFEESELEEKSNVQFLHVANSTKPVSFYTLDVIIAVGYRVNSFKATKFRVWATRILKEYLIKGFVLDDDRLKQGNKLFGKDYFRELLERIREIRASERMFYEKITDLYATAIDYDKNDPVTHLFFAKVQNKLEFAIVGKTSAEIIKSRASSKMPNMGLKVWKNAKRDGKIQKSDVTIAKNYLNEDELRRLNALVNMYLDFAELQAERNRLMKMNDWAEKLNAFLRFNEYNVLDGAGAVSKIVADNFAEKEYSKFKVNQDKEFKSDFNKIVDDIRYNKPLPKEVSENKKEGRTTNSVLPPFDNKLKGLLNTPPPEKKKKK